MILSSFLCIPLFIASVISFVPKQDKLSVKWLGMWGTFSVFLLNLVVFFYFDFKCSSYQLVEYSPWFSNISYHLGIDFFSLSFVMLTTLIFFLCALYQPLIEKEFWIAFLVLESMLLGCFLSVNLVFFYIFFEIVTIPLFFIIGIWGGENRLYASYKFFIFTFFGSLCFLLSILALYEKIGTFDLSLIKSFNHIHSPWIWLGIFLALAIKIPVWPFHIWLPEAHVQAPTTGSVVLASIVLKLGGYGLIRILWQKWSDMTIFFTPLMQCLGIISLIYGSLLAFSQKNIKKMIAFSSVAHMGYVLLGVASGDQRGIQGAFMQMISHGLISSGLFFCIGGLYERFKTYNIDDYKGLKKTCPHFSSFFFLIILGSIALPGTSGFVGEFLVILGNFPHYPFVSFCAAFGMILTPSYMLFLYQKIFLRSPVSSQKTLDISVIEKTVLSFCIMAILIIGILKIPHF